MRNLDGFEKFLFILACLCILLFPVLSAIGFVCQKKSNDNIVKEYNRKMSEINVPEKICELVCLKNKTETSKTASISGGYFSFILIGSGHIDGKMSETSEYYVAWYEKQNNGDIVYKKEKVSDVVFRFTTDSPYVKYERTGVDTYTLQYNIKTVFYIDSADMEKTVRVKL